jgi:hypothetical protein
VVPDGWTRLAVGGAEPTRRRRVNRRRKSA